MHVDFFFFFLLRCAVLLCIFLMTRASLARARERAQTFSTVGRRSEASHGDERSEVVVIKKGGVWGTLVPHK